MSKSFPFAAIHGALARRATLSAIPRIGAALLLVWATEDHGRDFYALLRWLVFGVAALTAGIAFSRRNVAWGWLAAMLTALFNPFAQVRLSLTTWRILDIAAAAFLLLSLWFVFETPRGEPPI